MIDIALDTWPYSGFSSTAESLFMGVPVITLRGKSFAHNIGNILFLFMSNNAVFIYISIILL